MNGVVHEARTPNNIWQAHAVTIRGLSREAPGVTTYDLTFDDPHVAAAYDCHPGQFNMLYLPGVGETPISVSGRSAVDCGWAHTIRVAGNTTRAIDELGVGGRLGLRGPFGVGWPMETCVGADVLLVAGGIGLAPLRPAIRSMLANRSRYGRLTLVYGARTPDALLYPREQRSWIDGGLVVHTTVDRAAPGWLGNVGVVTMILDRLRPLAPADTVMLVCGPEVMMRYAVRAATERGMNQQQIYVSMERNMQCAVGLCGHCQLGPAFICKDGPVLRSDRVIPLLGVEDL